jgi:effector-binding domain-containing protein
VTQTVATPAISPAIVELVRQETAIMHVSGPTAELPALLGRAFRVTMDQIAVSGGRVVGPPFARYLEFGARVEVDAGFPCTGPIVETELVHAAFLPGGRAVQGTVVGPYEEIGAAWSEVQAWITQHELVPTSPPWESYLSGPGDPGRPVTQIVFPVR